jgi:hypothetical protein
MALVWHEKASRTALQTSSVNLTHTLLVQTHSMTTVKEIADQRRLRCSTVLFCSIPNITQRMFEICLFFYFLFCVKFVIPFKYSLCIVFILLNKFSIITKNLIEFLLFDTYVIFHFFLLINRSCLGGGAT